MKTEKAFDELINTTILIDSFKPNLKLTHTQPNLHVFKQTLLPTAILNKKEDKAYKMC